MERNSWETALRCLEVALHPNTGDKEVIAAVNGYRRTAGGAPLAELCAEFARKSGITAEPSALAEELNRLSRENLDLRRLLLRRTDETEQRLHDLDAELLATQRRATEAERRLGELNAAHAEITDGLKREIFGLRGALDRTRHRVAEPGPTFRDVLSAARGQAQTIPHRAEPPVSRSPWTA